MRVPLLAVSTRSRKAGTPSIEGDSPESPNSAVRLGRSGSVASRILWRFGRRVLILLAVSIVVFAVLRLLPTDPAVMLLPPNAPLTDLIALRHTLGLDRPIPIQYMQWLGHAVRGDFGQSLQNNRPVGPQILAALPTTLQLLAGGLFLGVLAGLASGIYAFIR